MHTEQRSQPPLSMVVFRYRPWLQTPQCSGSMPRSKGSHSPAPFRILMARSIARGSRELQMRGFFLRGFAPARRGSKRVRLPFLFVCVAAPSHGAIPCLLFLFVILVCVQSFIDKMRDIEISSQCPAGHPGLLFLSPLRTRGSRLHLRSAASHRSVTLAHARVQGCCFSQTEQAKTLDPRSGRG